MTRGQSHIDDLPVRDGFRLRGLEMTRIETFTDAAFAFALTLLVVSLDIPASYGDLMIALKGIPAFALSALLLMVFWSGHNTWSRRYGLDDGLTVVLSCLLVFTVLVYVYPLKFLFRSLIAVFGAWLGFAVDFDTFEITRAAQVNHLFVIYGLGFVTMCAAIILLNLHAWHLRESLQLNELERYVTKAEIGAWLVLAGAGLLSIVLALTTPISWGGLPGWAYSLLAVVMPVYGTLTGRRAKAISLSS